MGTADLLLHPIRFRIVQCLLGGRELTTADLRDELPDVAAATVYRQVATLLEGGLIEIVAERRARGAVERTYRIREAAASVGAAEAATMTTDEHRRAFTVFVAGLLGDFERYLSRADVDLARDQVGYRQAALHLTDEEMQAFLHDLVEVVAPRLALPPAQGRTRRLFSTIVMPAFGIPQRPDG